MLKAVRFDPELESHKQLIEFMETYLDKRGKPNHSEAIRLLMEKGYEAIHGTPIQYETKVEAQSVVNYEEIKSSLMDELMSTFGHILKPETPKQETYTEPEVYEKPPQPSLPPKQNKPPVNVGGLMGNLLNNANRG